jgi:hypothetical protein
MGFGIAMTDRHVPGRPYRQGSHAIEGPCAGPLPIDAARRQDDHRGRVSNPSEVNCAFGEGPVATNKMEETAGLLLRGPAHLALLYTTWCWNRR